MKVVQGQMTNRMKQLVEEARRYGWKLYRLRRPIKCYVLTDENGDMYFRTLDEAERKLRAIIWARLGHTTKAASAPP
jgi:hypothetical protein